MWVVVEYLNFYLYLGRFKFVNRFAQILSVLPIFHPRAQTDYSRFKRHVTRTIISPRSPAPSVKFAQ